jgi:predicted nucleic acid-binding protein
MAQLLVIDASALLGAWLPQEPYQVQADALLGRYEEGHVELCSSTLLPHEILNGLWIAVRGKAGQPPRITLQDAQEAWELFQGLKLRLEDTGALARRILELVSQYQHRSTYDMTYVALAENLKSPLITGDRKLLSAVSQQLDWVIPLWEWEQRAP